MLFSPIEQCLDPGHCAFSELRQGILHPWRKLPLLAARCVALFAITRIAEMKKLVSFLYKSNIPSMREISKSGHGITGAYGKPATLMEGG